MSETFDHRITNLRAAVGYLAMPRERALCNANLDSLSAELAALKEEAAWVRKKFGLPEDTPFVTGGGVTLAGALHILDHEASGYRTYIAAYKCEDKQGEIARLTVELAALRERCERAEAQAAENATLLLMVRVKALINREIANQAALDDQCDAFDWIVKKIGVALKIDSLAALSPSPEREQE